MRGWFRAAVVGVALAAGAPPKALAAEPTTPLWLSLPALPAMPQPTASGFVTHDGARLYYAAFGRGRPVILLHGGLANSEYWANQIPALTGAGWRVITIDSRGHGRSSRDQRRFTYELMASDVVAVMDALKLPRAAVAGWSDGAIIGLVMALRNPERVERVFAFAANMDPSGVTADPDHTAQGEITAFAKYRPRAEADYRRLSPTPSDFSAFSRAIKVMWDTEPNYTAAELARIRTPVAIVDGDHDEAIVGAHTEYLARSIPGAKLILLPSVGHFAMMEDPARFNAALLGFLADPSDTTRRGP